MAEYTVVVPDTSLLQRVCGTNDSNLKLIESCLNCSVYARGNELSVDCDDERVHEQFNFIIDRIIDEFSDSSVYKNDLDLIYSVLNLNKDSNLVYSKTDIVIPGGLKKVYPKTNGQLNFINSMNNFDLIFALGPAGSGKTFLAIAHALSLVLNHLKKHIILTRPVVEAGENLGYLPGDLSEKINPYIRPLFDAMYSLLPKDVIKKMMDCGIIEIAPLAYMRGRTLNDSVIILDEAQNTTKEQMKMFLTRMGENSKIIITGDPSQIDLQKRIPSGLIHSMEILKDIKDISFVHLTTNDVVRNPLVKKILQAYENEERKE